MVGRKAKIGEILVKAGVVTEEQLRDALSAQSQMGGTLGENLVRLGHVTEEALLGALSHQLGLQHVNLAKVEVPVSVLRVVKFDTVRRRRLLPVALEGKQLVVAMCDPTDLGALSEVEFQSGYAVKALVLSAAHFDRAMEYFSVHEYGTAPLKLQVPSEKKRLRLDSSLESFLQALVTWKGQDLHLSAGAVPAIRVDNEMRRLSVPALKPEEVERMIFSILTPVQQEAFERSWELDFAYSVQGVARFRCNVYRQRGSIAFTARHVNENVPSVGELGLPDFIRDYALRPQGLILVVGPNGHGKSTTLSCMVDIINRERKANIITIEDPVEFTHRHKNSNVNQREVGNDTFGFAEGLRHVFRQNPDVIVIGELRDHESISVALTASETGHLVMGTLHANSATSAVDRIVDGFPGNQQVQVRAQLADSLQLVFSQRLLRRAGGPGRVLAWEKMGTSLRVRNAIREGKTHVLRGTMQTNVEELTSIDWSLAELVSTGKAKYDEALKFADNASYFNDLLKLRGVLR